VGFVAAAVGRVGEFSQEAPFLQQVLSSQDFRATSSSSSELDSSREHTSPAAAAADSTADHTGVAAAAAAAGVNGHAPSTGTSSSGVGDSSPPAAAAAAVDAVAVEVVLLGVVSGYRRQGVASRLLQQVKRHARSQG
jgi:GNAT superfamily N-acetyltransferase